MFNNDIMDEDYGKEQNKAPENEPVDMPWPVGAIMFVILACILSVIVCLTIRLDAWLIH